MRNLSNNLKLHLKGVLNENSTVQDFSGNNLHGVVTNATSPEGRDGICMRFDGTDDQVLISDNSAVQNIFDGGGSISAWIKPNSDGENSAGRILDKTGIALYLQSEASGKTEIKFLQDFSTTNGEWSSTVTQIPIDSWSFVIITYDNSAVGNDPLIYINGNLVALTEDSTPVGTRTTDVGSNLYIGDNSAGDRCFDGDIEDLRFYDTELEANEVQSLSRQSIRSHSVTPVGKMRRYMEFDGVDDYLSRADDGGLNMGTSDFVVSSWVKLDDFANGGIISKQVLPNPTCAGWSVATRNGNLVELYSADGTDRVYKDIASSNFNSGWNHLLFVFDKSNEANSGLYIDKTAYLDSWNGTWADIGSLDNSQFFEMGCLDTYYFNGEIATTRIFNFGEGGLPTGDDLTNLISGLYEKPNSPLSEYGLAGYEDAVYTDTHDGAGSVTSLVVGKYYEFIQGTPNHDLNYGGGILTSTGVFLATQAAGTISNGDGSDHVRRTGERAFWKLDGTNPSKNLDETSNALHLTQSDTSRQPAIALDLEIKQQFDPLFYESLSDAKVSNRWITKSGSFEPVFISSWGTHGFEDDIVGKYGIKCVTAGVVGIPVPQQMNDLTKQNLEFSWKMYKGADANELSCKFIADDISASPTGYQFTFDADEKITLNEIGVGDLGISAASYKSISTWYEGKVKHSAASLFTFYIDDVAVTTATGSNPVTDATTTDTKYWVFEMDAGDIIADPKANRY